MWEYNYTDELYHYGVKGMKWGVRRLTKAAERAEKDANDLRKHGYKKEADAVQKVADKNRKKANDKKIKDSRKEDVKNRRKLSDADLKKKVERLSMEKKLKDLTSDDVSPGKKFVSGVMSSSGKKVATAFVTGAALYGTRAALTKEFNIAELGRYMTPKPKK